MLPLADPHGLKVALVESSPARRFTPWDGSPIPPERQIRGLHGAQIWERNPAVTTAFLTRALGFQRLGEENGWTRYGFSARGGRCRYSRASRSAQRGAWGVGSVHHLAWRVDDDEHQLAVRGQVAARAAMPPTVIDRFWFKSVYFKEPGGVLFEIATDGPGFAADEDPAHLGRMAGPSAVAGIAARIDRARASAA